MSPTCRSARERIGGASAQGPDFTLVVEARDFLRVNLPRLTSKQRATVIAWAGGKTCREIAAEEGVSEEAIHQRLSGGLRRLRELGEK